MSDPGGKFESIELTDGLVDRIFTPIAGVIATAGGGAGLCAVASISPMPDGWRRMVGISVMALIAIAFGSAFVWGLLLLLYRQRISIDFCNLVILTRTGLPYIVLRTRVYSAGVFESIVLSTESERGIAGCGLNRCILIRGPKVELLLRTGIDKYPKALAEAERFASGLGLAVLEERSKH